MANIKWMCKISIIKIAISKYRIWISRTILLLAIFSKTREEYLIQTKVLITISQVKLDFKEINTILNKVNFSNKISNHSPKTWLNSSSHKMEIILIINNNKTAIAILIITIFKIIAEIKIMVKIQIMETTTTIII